MAQGGDVVPDRGAGGDGRARHLGLHRIDRDRDVALSPDRADQRDQPLDLHPGRDGIGARPRGFRTQVQDVRAFRDEAAGMGQGDIGVEETAAVRKAVGRHVDDPHHAGRRSVGSETHRASPWSYRRTRRLWKRVR